MQEVEGRCGLGKHHINTCARLHVGKQDGYWRVTLGDIDTFSSSSHAVLPHFILFAIEMFTGFLFLYFKSLAGLCGASLRLHTQFLSWSLFIIACYLIYTLIWKSLWKTASFTPGCMPGSGH